MSDPSSIESDALYLAMTRPAMLLGVPLVYAGASLMICSMGFVWLQDVSPVLGFGTLGLYPIFHLYGLWRVQRDPRWIDVLATWSTRCAKCRTRALFGSNTYFGG